MSAALQWTPVPLPFTLRLHSCVKPTVRDFDQQRHGDPGEDDDDPGSNESGRENLRRIWTEQRHQNRWNEHADRPYRDPCKQGHFPTWVAWEHADCETMLRDPPIAGRWPRLPP